MATVNVKSMSGLAIGIVTVNDKISDEQIMIISH